MDYKVKIRNIKESVEFESVSDDCQGFITSLTANNFQNNDIIFIAKNDAEMNIIEKQINYFNPTLEESFEILIFPAWDCQPYDINSPKNSISSDRINVLNKIINRNHKNFIVITTANSILQKLLPTSILKKSSLSIKAGEKSSIKNIIDFLIYNGYQRQSCAYNPSEFALRGGIIDIVVSRASDAIGYRIDFFGEEIESIKEFDPSTQLSLDTVKEFKIIAASEILLNEETSENFRQEYRKKFSENFNISIHDDLYDAISSKRYFNGSHHWMPLFYKEDLVDLFSYLINPVIFINNKTFSAIELRDKEINELYQARINNFKESKLSGLIYNPIEPEMLYLSKDYIFKKIFGFTHLIFNNFDSCNSKNRVINLEFSKTPDLNLAARTKNIDVIELLSSFTKENNNKRIIIACLTEGSRERIKSLISDHNINPIINVFPIEKGFITSDFIIISEQDIFGEKIVRKKNNNKASVQRILEEGLSINVNELVVHKDHGIAKFGGIHKISVGNISCDMIKLYYKGSDILFTPVEDIDLITRYGDENSLIELDSLSTKLWTNKKKKVYNKIKIAAEKLIQTAAARKTRNAQKFIPDQYLYDEFKAGFNYTETLDQINAIEEIENDLSLGSPMDRLVCGDVGFGKTEVAMRAAFIVACKKFEDETKKYQVAIITPTTLLCRQHFKNFSKRFEGTAINIAQLSRMNSVAKNKEIKKQIESGEIDIIIGTHALLAKNLKFKNISLLIVDEEQHFGVAQKERLKEFKNEIHILSLSATPIPRTLQMSMTGVKDLSLIATPPIDRLAVRNFVLPYDSVIIKEAIIREYQRVGKVFFVVPRIKDIEDIKKKLEKILPSEIKICVAHGQMPSNQLDDIMNQFYDNKIDLLLSTTIIESGIDVASANTIIIYKAEMFGLAQLYQLRGRVGRSKTRGYAYFILSEKNINKEAYKKLEVMKNLDDLGVGFTIASHDMDIRGSGNIIGEEQSGHIKDIGVELYQQMLIEEIEKIKNSDKNNLLENIDDVETTFNPQIKLSISLFIDENYISDISLRMSFYKKIASVKNISDLERIVNELNDRFGKVPQETINLMQIAIIKNKCKILNIEKIELIKDGIVVSLKNNKFKDSESLLNMVFDPSNKIKLMPSQKILFANNGIYKIDDFNNCEQKIAASYSILEKFSKL